MKYLKRFENIIDPYNEEIWDEPEKILLPWGAWDDQTTIYDVPPLVNNRLIKINDNESGILNKDFTKILTTRKFGKLEPKKYVPDDIIKSPYKILNHDGSPNTSKQYKIKKIKDWDDVKHGLIYNKYHMGQLIFKCSPKNRDINNIENYHIIGGLDNPYNSSLYSYSWDDNKLLKVEDHWGAKYHFIVY